MQKPAESSQQRLGRLVSQRRQTMGMSISEAARLAGVDRATWTGVERGTRQPEDFTLGRIEATLQWASGSIDAIRDGADPRSTVDDQAARSPEEKEIDRWESDLIRDIRGDPRLDDETKLELVARTRRIAVQQRAALREAELEREALRDRFRLLRGRAAS